MLGLEIVPNACLFNRLIKFGLVGFFGDRVSDSLGLPRIHYVAENDLTSDSSASTFQVL